MAIIDLDADVPDAQDQAEVADETNLTEDGEGIANFDTLADVFDVTTARDDADDEPTLDADDYAPDDLDALETDEDELGDDSDDPFENDIGVDDLAAQDNEREMRQADRGRADDIEGLDLVADADTVEGGEDDFTNFQSRALSDGDLKSLGYQRPEGRPPGRPIPARRAGIAAESGDSAVKRGARADKRLDEALKETFPASDPAPVSPGSD